jgi:Tol biopolymer transport system component
MTLAAGTRLGPYEILAPLGAGGMGEVYRARDTRLDRTVAIKVLSSRLSLSAEARQRFDREARTISKLSHPNVCALYDVGREGETDYLVMELLEGESLAQALARGPLPLEQALRLGIEIAGALDAAHRSGVVHRDLKPGNVMLTKAGVKLLDFGLARGLASGTGATGLSAMATEAGALTAEGTLLGTLSYMAPEQLEGKEADARTDIFAFGAVLYEMVTGRKAFSGESQASLISAIMTGEPAALPTLLSTSPPSLDRLLRTCLAKDPEERWQSAGDLKRELRWIGEEGGAEARAPAAAQQALGLWGWGAAALLLLALLATLLGPWRAKRQSSAAGLRFTIPPPAGSSFQGMLALSPDGSRLAFVATGSDGRDLLWIRPLDSLESRALEGTDGAAYPFWSPDGSQVGFFAQGKLKKVKASGGSPQTICDVSNPRGGSWGSTGTIIFSADTGGEIRSVAENGSRAVSLSHLAPQPGVTNRWPSFLPDGRHFLYHAVGSESAIHWASLDSKDSARLVSSDGGAIYAPPGFLLYRSAGRLMGQRFDATRRLLIGEAFPVVDQIWFDGSATGAMAISDSHTGLLACQTGGAAASRLLLYDRSGHEVGAIGSVGGYWEPTFSPDGQRLAVPKFDPEGIGAGIWMGDVQNGRLARLTSKGPISATPLWSPDGRRIIYSSYASGEVYIRDASGAEEEKVFFKSPSFTPLDDWSRDGRLVFYEVFDWHTFHADVWVRDLARGQSRAVLQAKFTQEGARLSPDGHWLAYASQESGIPEVFVRSFPEARERRQVSTDGGTQPRWRADGRELFYISPDRKVMAVDVRTEPQFETGTPRALFQTRILSLVEARNHYDVTPDGQRFVVNSRRQEDASLPITVVSGWMPETH